MKLVPELMNSREFVGRVEWVGVASTRRKELATPDFVDVIAGLGIVGEHHFGHIDQPHRQVTLIQHEHLDVIARLLGRADVSPGLLRRNIVVSGINVAALRFAEFSVGDVVLQGTGDCAPCALMDHTLGAGGYAATVAHGGITAAVGVSGRIVLGAEVRLRRLADAQ